MKKLGYILLPLNWIAFDKQKHAAAGIWLGAAGFILSQTVITQYWLSALIGVVFAYGISVIKEFLDDEFDWWDILATVLGSIFINVILLLIWQK